MTDQEKCDICGQTPFRHVAPAYADHQYAPPNSNGYGTPIPERVRESLAAQMAATRLALTAKEEPTEESP